MIRLHFIGLSINYNQQFPYNNEFWRKMYASCSLLYKLQIALYYLQPMQSDTIKCKWTDGPY